MSSGLSLRLDEILKKSQLADRHSKFQLEKFVIGKEPTGQAQLWQIVRELDARRDTIQSFQKDLADAEDNLELFDLRIERLNLEIKKIAQVEDETGSLEIQEREINIRKLQREKEALVSAAQKVNYKLKCVLEETAFLVCAYDAIVAQIGEMKPLDDEEAQREMWNEKLLEELNLRVILQRPIDSELVRTIMCLPEELPVKQTMIQLLESRQQQMLARGAENKQLKRPQVEPPAKIDPRKVSG